MDPDRTIFDVHSSCTGRSADQSCSVSAMAVCDRHPNLRKARRRLARTGTFPAVAAQLGGPRDLASDRQSLVFRRPATGHRRGRLRPWGVLPPDAQGNIGPSHPHISCAASGSRCDSAPFRPSSFLPPNVSCVMRVVWSAAVPLCVLSSQFRSLPCNARLLSQGSILQSGDTVTLEETTK